jgi:pimeloyl-ACP methyl ester carboxylesterase
MSGLRAAMVGLLFFVAVAHAAPQASAVASVGCAPDIGSRQPMLLVHGFRSNEGIWAQGRPSMIRALRVLPGLYVRTFDYSRVNTKWVVNPLIGPSLADRITCLADASAAAGGPGKVIVVGHSLGGLAIRHAAARMVDRVQVADRLGLIITIGTPNLGSYLRGNALGSGAQQAMGVILRTVCEGGALTTLGQAQPLCDTITELANSQAGVAFTPGSQELAALPTAPSKVPLRAVVGSVDHVSLAVLTGHLTVDDPGDLVVGEDSASVGARDPAHGGGLVRVRCSGWELLSGVGTLPDCSHTLEPQNIDVQRAVVAGIRRYLSATAQSPMDLHRVDWSNVTIPGSLCRSPQDIKLHNGQAINVPSSFDGPTDNYPQDVYASVDKVAYGDLTGDGRDDAALPVLCANHNSTAAGQTAFGVLIFEGSGGEPQLIATLTGLQPRLGEPPNFIKIEQISHGRITVTETWYGAHDANCCPSGRARDVWRYADGRVSVVSATVTVQPQ